MFVTFVFPHEERNRAKRKETIRVTKDLIESLEL